MNWVLSDLTYARRCWLLPAAWLFGLLSLCVGASGVPAQDEPPAAASREGYLVDVELPLIADRDERVRQQIMRIADRIEPAGQRPIVVLRFQSAPLSDVGDPDNGGLGTRGSLFGRCRDLASFMNQAQVTSRVRLVAYVPDSVVGHAVLPVLACEEILAAPDAELGLAAIDEPLDETIAVAYRDMVRNTLPPAVVTSMLDPRAEVYSLQLADGGAAVVGREEADRLASDGVVLKRETIWDGRGLASYSGQQLKRWTARLIEDANELPAALGLDSSLRTAQQLPREWKAVSVDFSGLFNRSRVFQLIRSMEDEVRNQDVNLIVFRVADSTCELGDAIILADAIAGLKNPAGQDVYTLSIVSEPVRGAAAIVAVACDETSLLTSASLGPDELSESSLGSGPLEDLAEKTGRPIELLSVLADRNVEVKEYIHQVTGKRAIFIDAVAIDEGTWQVKAKVAGGEPIANNVALRYRLIDSIDDTAAIAFSRLGVEQPPQAIATPWLDASIQMALANPWIPRLLLTIGFFALMAELGNPGIGAGGFLASLCFLGFFWVEGLNGNVEWLEILLFVAGLVSLAIEIFVVPGFGVFGIGGLLMVFVSVVLASQTFVWPTTSAQLSEVSVNLLWVACLALGGMIGLLFMHKQLERLPMLRWLSLQPGGSDNLDEIDIRESIVHREHLLGQDGLTTTRLNPSGKAQFGNEIVAVIGNGSLVAEGTPVRVVEVRGNLILVEPLG